MLTTGMSRPNPSRAEIQAGLARLGPVPDDDAGAFGWSLNINYDRKVVLSRLPGDDLGAIAASASTDAAASVKSGKLYFVWALPMWIAGLLCLLVLAASITAVMALGIGSIGLYFGAKKLARSNHDTLLIDEIRQLFPSPGAAPGA